MLLIIELLIILDQLLQITLDQLLQITLDQLLQIILDQLLIILEQDQVSVYLYVCHIATLDRLIFILIIFIKFQL